MLKKKITSNMTFEVNEGKRTVVCKIKSKGQNIFGIAKCSIDDVFDVEKGKLIAAYRAEIKQRQRDLRNTKGVICLLQDLIHKFSVVNPEWKRSKHWDNFLRIACEEKNKQMENIKFCKDELKEILNN